MRVHVSHLYRAVALVLCLMLSPLPGLAQTSSSQGAGQISALVPQATRNGSIAKAKEEVNWNDTLRTEGAGRARVQLRDGSILSLGSNSELKVTQHDPATQQTELELNYGRVRSRVVQITKPGGKFEIKTPTAVAGVIGTDFSLFFGAGRLQAICYSGQMFLRSLTGAMLTTVNAGQMVEIVNGQVIGPTQTPPGVQQDDINQTNVGNGGEAAVGATGGSLLRTVLIIFGVATASALITAMTTGSPGPSPSQSPTSTFCSSCDSVHPRQH